MRRLASLTTARQATPPAVPPPAVSDAAPVGTSRDNPVPVGATAEAGPLRLTLLESVRGPAAVDAVLAASDQNDRPRDGVDYVLVRLAAENAGAVAVPLSDGDFGLTGSSGVVQRFLGVVPPAPILAATLKPGERTEGWAAFAAPSAEPSLILLFDSLSIPGNWADRLLAVDQGARIGPQAQRAAPVDAAGRDAAAPVGLSQPVTTEQWQVELLEVLSGEDVFNIVDYRTGALGIDDATGADGSIWWAVRLRVTNAAAGDALAYFSPNALRLVDETGAPIVDLGALTPPRPDAAGWYYPGASREGWVAYDIPTDQPSRLLRLLPEPDTNPAPDPRYLEFS